MKRFVLLCFLLEFGLVHGSITTSLFLLGDSTNRIFLHNELLPKCKANHKINYEEVSNPYDYVSGAWLCSEGLFKVIGFFMHWGVDDPPYYFVYEGHTVSKDFPGENPSQLNSTLSIYTALERFQKHTQNITNTSIVIFNSNLWDCYRKEINFRHLYYETWRFEHMKKYEHVVNTIESMIHGQLWLSTIWWISRYECNGCVDVVNGIIKYTAMKKKIKLYDPTMYTTGLMPEQYLIDGIHENSQLSSLMYILLTNTLDVRFE
jgi:hypothetical protein